MNLPKRHQEIFDEAYPDGYLVDKAEVDYFHVMYVDAVKDGAWTRGVPVLQKYSEKEWRQTLAILERHAIKAVTGHSEYSVIHDPVKAREAAKAEAAKVKAANVKSEVKPKGRSPQK